MRILAIAVSILLPVALAAQEEREVGRLAGLLEDSLSSETFQVQIDGLEGAFSSRAEIERMTFLDATGPWLVIENAILDWNRAALLRGRVEVNELAAELIRVDRMPASAPSADETPSPNAPGFAGFKLPELPVSVSVGAVSAPRIQLAPEVLGESLEASLNGKLTLEGGDGSVDITVERTDVPGTRLRLAGGFTNSTQQLVVDVSARAREGGTLTSLIGMPGAPDLNLSIAGAGSLSDFLAEVQLRTDEVLRVGGDIWIFAEDPEAAPERLRIRTNLDGDLRDLVPPDFASFFGPTTSILVSGEVGGDAPLEVDTLEIETDAIAIDGGFTLAPSGWPDRISLDLRMEQGEGRRVRLPVPDLPVYLDSTELVIGFDAGNSDEWQIGGSLKGLEIGNNAIGETTLDAGGRLALPGSSIGAEADGTLELSVDRLDLDDEGLQELLGAEIDLSASFNWSDGDPLKIEGLEADANRLSLVADALLSEFAEGIDLQLDAGVAISDLSTASSIAGLPLEGSLEGTFTGKSTLLAGTFEAEAALRGSDVGTGTPEIDKIIGDTASVDLAVRRTVDGFFLDTLNLTTDQFTAEAGGQASDASLNLLFAANLQDLSVLTPGIAGPLDLKGSVSAESGPFTVDIGLTAPQDLSAEVSGELDRDLKSADLTADGNLDLTILSAILEPRKLDGKLSFDLALDGPIAPTSLSGNLTMSDGAFEDQSLEIALGDLAAMAEFEGNRIDFDASGTSEPDGQLELSAELDFLKDDPSQFLPYAVDYLVKANDEGLVSRLARLPSKQVFDLELAGRAAVDEVSADVLLKSNGSEKLKGEAGLVTNDSDSTARDFSVDLRADATGVLPQPIVDLLGSDVLLAASGTLMADSAIELSSVELNSEALRAKGSGAISGKRLPERIILNLDVSHADGDPVVLPIPDLPARIKRASVDLNFEPASAGDWKLDARIDEAQVLDNGVESLRLRAGGPIEAVTAAGLPTMSGEIDLTASGLSLANSQIEQFLTGDIAAGTQFNLSPETGLALKDLFARSGVVDLMADASASGFAPDDKLSVTAKLALRDEDTASPLRGSIDLSAQVDSDIALKSLTFDLTGASRGFGLGQQPLDALLAGDGKLEAKGTKSGSDIEIEALEISTSQFDVSAAGRVASGGSDLSAEAKLANLALLVPELPGPLTMTAKLSGKGGAISVQSRIDGPAGINADISGTVEQDFGSADIVVKGGSRLEILTPFIRPAAASGQVLVDIALNGPFALPSVAGQITLSDGRIADPALSLAIEQLRGTLSLVNSGLQVALTGNSSQGGSLSVDGQLGLTGGLPGSIKAALNQFQYVDPRLLSTSLDGAIQVEGPIAGGANISGEIDVGRTEVRLSTSLGGGGASVEGLTHVGESSASRQTRKRAGLIAAEKKASGASKAPVYGLDVLIDANNPIFIRGLGLDAEVGGDVKIGGTTAAIEPVGTFELVRGRADILGQRLELTEGTVTLSGNAVPIVRFVATRRRSDFEVSAIISGPLDDPDISFESNPTLPEDQVLARLLFDTDLGNLSGLQALQLANAVAVMRGGSGVNLLGSIRDDLGIDNLDLTTDEEGRTNLKVGRYINDTTYTDFEVRSDGNTAITLNIDLTQSLTVRGIAESDGSSGGGIFFERDF